MIVSRRHKKLPIKTRVARKIEEIGRHEWDKVFPNVIESYQFFKTLDECDLEQFSFYYILAYEKKTLVGVAACFMMEYSLDTSMKGPLRRISNAVKKIRPRIFSIKTLVCGMPLGSGRMGITGDSDKVFRVMLRRMEQIAKKEKAAIIAFKDFGHSDTHLLDPLQHEGFAKFDGLPSTELGVWFKDFEEYLKTLSAASRYDLRRKFRKVDGHVKFDFEIATALDDKTLHDVYRMYLDIVDRHEMGFELLPMEFFRRLPRNMPEETKFFLWRIDGKLAAFVLCFVSGDLLIDYYVGMDYSIAYKYHIYFVKFRDILNWCIRHGIKRYDMGMTGYEPKRRLGFDLVPTYIYAKLRNRMVRPIFNMFCQFLKFENFDPDLKYIKEKRGVK